MEQAFQKAKKDWMSNPNINGVFRSLRRVKGRWTDEIGIQFHVRKKLSLDKLSPDEIIPVEIDGIKTDVIQANAKPVADINRYAAIQGGMSLGVEENYGAGTLGIVILDDTNGPVGITCAHCILVEGTGPLTPGYPIHPATEDGGIAGRDRIGTILDWDLSDRGADVAGISLTYPYGLSVFDTLVMPTAFRTPEINDVLYKLGRTTSLTEMKVSGYGTTTVDYSAWGVGSLILDGVISLIPNGDDPNELIILGGDSGSLCYYPNTFEAAGIVTSLASESNIGFAQVFSSVLAAAGVLSPVIPVAQESERKGAMNVVVQWCHEFKGSAILSGSSPIFSTRLTAVNQDTTLGYPTIEDLFAAGGIHFLDGTETEETESGTLPTWTATPTEWSDTPVAWGSYLPDTTSIVVPTYVNSSSFTVGGDQGADYPVGLKLYLVHGVGLDAVVSVISAVYNAGTDKTTVTVDPASVLVSITQVKFGLLPAQMPVHAHSRIEETYTQVGHGFVALTPIYRKSDSTWAKAKADALATAEAVGIVESASGNNFTVIFGGLIKNQIGITPGAGYFVSTSTAGLLVVEDPDASMAVSKPMMIGITTTTGYVNNMRGLEIAS